MLCAYSHIEYTFLYPDLFSSGLSVLFIPSLQPDSQVIARNPGIYIYSYLRPFVLLPERMTR